MDKEICKTLETKASQSTKCRTSVIIPSVCDFYFTPHRFSCLGAQVLCKILLEHDYLVDLFNFPLIDTIKTIVPIPQSISYLKPFIDQHETGKLSFFTHFHRFGADHKTCAKIATSNSSSLCFISCFAFSYSKEALEIAHEIKNINPMIQIVIGGAGVSAHPHYFINQPAIDFVIVGEAEVSVGLFLEEHKTLNPIYNTVPNLYFKQNDIVIEPRIKKVTSAGEISPSCAKVHETKKAVYYSLSISRGCYKKCRFCSNFLAHGENFRKVPITAIESFVNNLDLDVTKSIILNFEDDNLLFEPSYFLDVMQKIKKRFHNISFLSENGMDYNLLTFDLVDQLISMGLKGFNFTLASSNKDVLALQNREGSLVHFESIVKHIATQGIPVLSYFICGLKGDSKESIASVLAYLYSLPTMVGISMFYAIPNLPDFQDTTVFDKKEPRLCNGSSAYPWNNSLSTKEMITAFRLSRYINLVKSENKSDVELELIQKINNEERLFTLHKCKREFKIVPVLQMDNELVRLFFEGLKRP